MEFLDVVDEDNQLLGKVEEREVIHREGIWHREIAIWVMNEEGEILLQKRALSKKTNPGKWGLTAGHIDAGEKEIIGAIREIKEEIGIVVTEKDLKELLCIKCSDVHSESKIFNNYYAYHYFLRVNQTIEEYKIQKKELSEVKYFTLEELEKIIEEKNEKFTFSKRDYMTQIMEFLKKKRSELQK